MRLNIVNVFFGKPVSVFGSRLLSLWYATYNILAMSRKRSSLNALCNLVGCATTLLFVDFSAGRIMCNRGFEVRLNLSWKIMSAGARPGLNWKPVCEWMGGEKKTCCASVHVGPSKHK